MGEEKRFLLKTESHQERSLLVADGENSTADFKYMFSNWKPVCRVLMLKRIHLLKGGLH
jgi:hypothetical protein